jgi:hypothetical protein
VTATGTSDRWTTVSATLPEQDSRDALPPAASHHDVVDPVLLDGGEDHPSGKLGHSAG